MSPAPLSASALTIEYTADDGMTWTEIAGLNQIQFSEDAPFSVDYFFGADSVRVHADDVEYSGSAAGVEYDSDPGQAYLKAQAAAREKAYIRVLKDGTDGFEGKFFVQGRGLDISRSDKYQAISFDFISFEPADIVTVGNGGGFF